VRKGKRIGSKKRLVITEELVKWANDHWIFFYVFVPTIDNASRFWPCYVHTTMSFTHPSYKGSAFYRAQDSVRRCKRNVVVTFTTQNYSNFNKFKISNTFTAILQYLWWFILAVEDISAVACLVAYSGNRWCSCSHNKLLHGLLLSR